MRLSIGSPEFDILVGFMMRISRRSTEGWSEPPLIPSCLHDPEHEPPAEHPSAVAHASLSALRAARVQVAGGARAAGRSAAEDLDASEHGATRLTRRRTRDRAVQ